eukprot:g12759.t1
MLAGVYLVYNLFKTAEDLKHALEASAFYKDKLLIPSDDVLACMSWAEVVDRIILEQKRSPFVVKQDELTALQITNIIMREENLIIGLVNNNHVRNHLPSWLPIRVFYSKSVMFAFRNIVYKGFFNHKSKVELGSLKPEVLCNHFRLVGFFALVGLGPICIFVHRNSPLERQWTGYAEWFFREYNELPHSFKQRLELSKQGANDIVDRNEIVANTPITDGIRKCIKYVSGSLLAILVVITCFDDSPLLFLKIADKNLLWFKGWRNSAYTSQPHDGASYWPGGYLAVLGFVVTLSDTSTKKKRYTGSPYEGHSSATLYMEKVILEFARCTHYIPRPWRQQVFSDNPNRRLMAGGLGLVGGEMKGETGRLGGGGRVGGRGNNVEQNTSEAVRRSGSGAGLGAQNVLNPNFVNHGAVGRLNLQEKYRIVEAFGRSREELQNNFYIPRIQMLLEEIFGLMVTPLLLLIYLPSASIDICNFVRNTLYESENLGDWCSLGCFELDLTDPRLSKDGKIEKSALSFAFMYRNTPSSTADSRPEVASPAVEMELSYMGARPSEQNGAALSANGNATANDDIDEYSEHEQVGMNGNGTHGGSSQGVTAEPPLHSERTAHASWGYPMSVLKLCHDLEDLAEKTSGEYDYLPVALTELKDNFVTKLHSGNYRMLPASQQLDFDNPVWFDSSHYFWLEVLLKQREEELERRRDERGERRRTTSGGNHGVKLHTLRKRMTRKQPFVVPLFRSTRLHGKAFATKKEKTAEKFVRFLENVSRRWMMVQCQEHMAFVDKDFR